MTLVVRKRKRARQNRESRQRKRLRLVLGGFEELPGDCVTTATTIRETGKGITGVSSGLRTDDKGTRWWNEELQESI